MTKKWTELKKAALTPEQIAASDARVQETLAAMKTTLVVEVLEHVRNGWFRGYKWKIRSVTQGGMKLTVVTCGANHFGTPEDADAEAQIVLRALQGAYA